MPKGIYIRTKESNLKRSLALKGKKQTLEEIQAKSIRMQGHYVSEEARRKIGIAFKGKKHKSDCVHCLKMKGRIPWNKGKLLGGISRGENFKAYYNKKSLERHTRKFNAEGSHTLEQWQELKRKFNFMCLCCKQQEPFIKLTEDHIVPLSRGGSDDILNIQPLCLSCNVRKFTKIINYINVSA